MIAILLLALPCAVVWVVVTANTTLDSLLVGWLLGVALLLLVRTERRTVHWKRLPDQILAFFIYSVTLGRDIVYCSLDVAKRVTKREMPINPGILAVATQDLSENDVITAFSAHGITITPGELVLDFDGAQMMYVHCLDVEASAQSADGAQTKRLRLLKRIIGSTES